MFNLLRLLNTASNRMGKGIWNATGAKLACSAVFEIPLRATYMKAYELNFKTFLQGIFYETSLDRGMCSFRFFDRRMWRRLFYRAND